MSQSGAIRQSSSVSPSRNACSSAESAGFGYASSFDQSGRPEKRSPSHHTVPALIASASVSDIGGITFRNAARARLLTTARRSGGSARIATIAASGASSQSQIMGSSFRSLRRAPGGPCRYDR